MADDAAQTPTPSPSGEQKSRLGFAWLRNMGIVFLIFLLGGAYFAYDGFHAYPARQARFAEFQKYQYLEAAETAGRIELLDASVDAPAAELERLEEMNAGDRSTVEQARLAWLRALKVLGTPTPAQTEISDPQSELLALRQTWLNQKAPAGLSATDIMSQHVIWVACAIIVLWVLWRFAAAASTTYRYDAQAKRLTLPNGTSFTPDELLEVDRRKWDKFFVFLRVEGIEGEVKIDLMKHTPVEQWVLEMEEASPHCEAPEEDEEEEALQTPLESADPS